MKDIDDEVERYLPGFLPSTQLQGIGYREVCSYGGVATEDQSSLFALNAVYLSNTSPLTFFLR
jgi:hypothetical protein